MKKKTMVLSLLGVIMTLVGIYTTSFEVIIFGVCISAAGIVLMEG